MKKFLLLAVLTLFSLSSFAELTGSGFYRVQNAYTKRYAYLLDNKGSFDVATTSADVNALQLYLGFLKASSDPATVFYFEHEGGYEYNVGGQGTDLYSFFGSFLKLLPKGDYDGRPSYYIYAVKSGMTKYLSDIRSDMSEEHGYTSVEGAGDNRLWYVDEITASGDNYFGISPTVTAGGKYYYPLYAGFPLALSSAGMKMYVVTRVEPQYGIAVITEVEGKIAAGVPLIIECSNPLATDNRIIVGPDGSNSSIPTNSLRGVYFDNETTTHYNRTPYDKNSMRTLAEVDGKLMFVRGDYEFCPRNQSYLQLATAEECAVDNYQVMTESEYNAYVESLSKHNPDGYYRMQNVASRNYAFLLDNAGSNKDVAAFQLYGDILKASSDPASVLYMSHPSGSGIFDRNLSAQGTSTQAIFGTPLSIMPADTKDGNQAYYVANSAGNIGDNAAGQDKGVATAGMSGDAAMWWLTPIASDSDNHFGIAPTLTAGGKYYHTLMADFPVAADSEGVNFYIINKIDAELEAMVLKRLEGVIPAGTPVIVECGNPLAADNKLLVGASGDAADVADNLLKAVYYNLAEPGHINRTPYDATSMRSLCTVDGRLAFAAANTEYLPRNEAYIALSNDLQKSVGRYKVLTPEEYEAYVASVAEILPDGYYRMQNTATKRNLFMLDDSGNLKSAEKSDLGALRLSSDLLKAQSDPATVFSFKQMSAAGSPVKYWVVSSQASSFAKITSSNMKLLPAGEIEGVPAFDAYVLTNNGKIYFSDSDTATEGEGVLSSAASATNHQWWLNAIDNESDDSCFGVAPTVTAKGKYFAPFMADFPFEPASDGMKVYFISKIDATNKMMVRKEVEGTVPAGAAVIIECENPLALDNRLAIGESDNMASLKGNRLTGTWFASDFENHVNRTAYDRESMRMLVEADGKLMFATVDIDFVPRNTAYVALSGSRLTAIPEYEVLTEEEYEAKVGVDAISADSVVDVYRVDGTIVKTSISKEDIGYLPRGIYILRSGESTEKYLVN